MIVEVALATPELRTNQPAIPLGGGLYQTVSPPTISELQPGWLTALHGGFKKSALLTLTPPEFPKYEK